MLSSTLKKNTMLSAVLYISTTHNKLYVDILPRVTLVIREMSYVKQATYKLKHSVDLRKHKK